MPIIKTANLLAAFPKQHAIAAGITAFVLAIGLSSPVSSSTPRTSFSLDLPTTYAVAPDATEKETAPSKEAEPALRSMAVQSGDTLSTLFEREGLSANDMYALLNSGKQGQKLAKLMPNEAFSYSLNDGKIETFVRHLSRLKSIEFHRSESGFSINEVALTPEKRLAYKATTLCGNLFNSADKIDTPQQVTMGMASIFGGVMDFVYDPREGDTFSVLYEELYLDGELIGYGDILASQYTNNGKAYEAYRFEDRSGDVAYYDSNGVSMRKAFLRAPVDFTRISSNFNPNRLHPIFKTKRPHRGIDYAAATGTPVYSAGDGRVVKSTYNKPSGNYVVVQHGPRYQTKYLHLNKRKVKVGQRVKQGQVIGTVGSTGYATGPHLHYEFLLDGVHRNPRTILKKLPKAQSIAKKELANFKSTIAPIQQQFAAYQRTAPFYAANLDANSRNQI